MSHLTERILSILLEPDDTEQNRLWYRYGIENLIRHMITYLTVFILSAVLWSFRGIIFSVIFICFFNLLRKRSGGYHIDSGILCYISSVILVVVSHACAQFIADDIGIQFVLLLLAATVILIAAPVCHPHLGILKADRPQIRKQVLLTLAVEIIVTLTLMLLSLYEYSVVIVMALFLNAVFIAISKITRQEEYL